MSRARSGEWMPAAIATRASDRKDSSFKQPQLAAQKVEQLRAQRFVGAVGGRIAALARVPQLMENRREKCFLAWEMVIDRTFRDVRAGGDAVHAGRVVAGREEFLDRGADDGDPLAVSQALMGGTGIHERILHRAVYFFAKINYTGSVHLLSGRPNS